MAATKDNGRNGLLRFLSENPEMVNMGIGLLGSLQDERKANAYQPAEIAKTQYGYLLGQGMGDPSKYKRNTFAQNAMKGALTGMEQRKRDDFNNKVLSLLKDKENEGIKDDGPTSLTSSALNNPSDNNMYNKAEYSEEYSPVEKILNQVPIEKKGLLYTPQKQETISDYINLMGLKDKEAMFLKRQKEKEEKEKQNRMNIMSSGAY